MITEHPELFWGLVASMWIGNCFLLLFNVPLVRIWLSVFKIKYSSLFPAILFFCCVGTYSINSNLNDIYTTAVFGVLGYIFLRFKLDPAPLILGFILGPMLEENFRLAMLMEFGSFKPFVTRPISAVLVGMIVLFFAWQLFLFFRAQWKPQVTR
jgi:TctA family transporter